MSTTHPTDVTTEWDDIQRKFGNLPKREKERTNEELDAELVERTEEQLLREARLRAWKKRLARSGGRSFGAPVHITADNFVKEVTDASRCLQPSQGGSGAAACAEEAEEAEEARDAREFADLAEKTGYYVPVLLLDDSREAGMLKEAWAVLARRFPQVKFTLGSARNVLKAGSRACPPSSVLLYFAGACVLQRSVASLFKLAEFELCRDSLENRLANGLENVLNGAKGHLPLVRAPAEEREDESSDSDSESDHMRSSGKDLKTDFLNKLTRGGVADSEASKTYTSWILDRALN